MPERLSITALGHAGDGIAETPGGRVFVPYTIPGETVLAERRGERATLVEVVKPSPDRIPPPCPQFGTCGGCTLQHLAPAAYLRWKREQVVAAFAQRGLAPEIDPIVPVAPASRRRAVLSAERSGRSLLLGFNRAARHEVVAIDGCRVLTPAILRALPALAELLAPLVPPGRRARVTVLAADNGLDVALDEVPPPDPRAVARLVPAAAGAPWLARLALLGEEAFRGREPALAAGAAELLPPPGGFVQAVAAAEDAMADAVVAALGPARRVADLFAGAGTFSLRLARTAAVLAVEGDAAACAALERAVRRARGLKPVEVRRRDLFRAPLTVPELAGYDAVVFDPPRAGAAAQAAMLAKSAVPQVVAVSCNPATLARDARILADGGYRIGRVTPIDQFLWTAHIEAVATFSRA